MSNSETEEGNVDELKIKAIIGFDGSVVKGFLVHADKKHVVYSLGNKVAIQNWFTKEQEFLSGHTNIISAIDVSKTGKYIASGQINHIGFKARVIIWSFETRKSLAQYEMHKVRVEAITFSQDEAYCISMGGRDCNSLVVWNLATMQPLCGGVAPHGIQGEVTCIQAMNRRGACFMTGGENHIAVWKIDSYARNIRSVHVPTAKLKRKILCMNVNERDEMCYCGTATGDVLKICLNFSHDLDILEPVKSPIMVRCFARVGTKKMPPNSVRLYSQGIRSMLRLRDDTLLIGAGDGTVEHVKEIPPKPSHAKMPTTPSLSVLQSTNVYASVTSLQLLDEHTILAGTANSEIFSVDLDTFEIRLLVTCHTSSIYDIAFPHNFSEVFATASKNDVRVWSMLTMQELLRIRVQNFFCSNVLFSYDGKSILTAWNDGVIRSFTPLTGRLIYAILNAHNKGVSALGITRKGNTLVSGGCEGQVRLWNVTPQRQQLLCTLKEHNAPVSAIHINQADNEAVSASTDGSCIIWDLEHQCRRQILFANTLFISVRYFPTGVQILTGGSDRKLGYWEVFDGSLVREIEGSLSGAINALDISQNGVMFVSGGNDQIVKLWKYNEGITTHVGNGHAAVITAIRFSPDGKHIVSTCAAGSVFIWECPFNVSIKNDDKNEESTIPVPKEVISSSKKEEIIQDLPSSVRSEEKNKKKISRFCECCNQNCSNKAHGDNFKKLH